ncbi:MAG: DUF5916 domain-containing protein [bacterium]
MNLLLLCLQITSAKAVEVKYTEITPKIDGVIEEIWFNGDSAYGFIQYQPSEGDSATEPTVVYVLMDENNIYFAFRCFTSGRQPVASFSGFEDQVVLYLDTFNNKTTAYYFNLCASGMYEDGIILEDGKCRDVSWDGVFYFVPKCYDDRFEIEIKIPFKSIRYKKGLNEWGVNFLRWCVKDYEASYWNPVSQKDGLRVSKFGRLVNVIPRSAGYYLEIHPEVFVRYDKDTIETKAKPSASLNLKWDITPQTTLNATVLPDFAQIESDPYTFNLTRYPIRLAERRPFFVEGRDIFRMANLGQKYFTPLEIYYSRRIGKPAANGYVPILGGVTFINKEKHWNWGILGALTDKTATEPFQGFGVLRAKRGVLENSEIGLLFSSAIENTQNYNYALGTDGVYRSGPLQLILQSALSDKNGKAGWANAGGGLYKTKTILAQGSFLAVSDSFDVSDIGYVPWIGQKSILLLPVPNDSLRLG